ncbi:MAG: AMP-binding enzyme [Flavobacteriales bacterium Tduv]
MARTIWGDHERFKEIYFSPFKGYYFSGEGVRRDEEGYYRILGRVDDVINISGHRLGTAEIENEINQHPRVSKSAVIGFPDDIKGEGIFVYIICHSPILIAKGLSEAYRKGYYRPSALSLGWIGSSWSTIFLRRAQVKLCGASSER